MRRFSPPAILVVLFGFVPATPAQTWNGLTATEDWNTAGNWTPSTVPNSSTAAVTFPDLSNAALANVILQTSVQVQSLNFTSAADSYSITSSGSPVLSGVTTITVGSGVISAQTINLNAVSTGSLTYPSAGSLTITNNAALGTSPTLVIGPKTVLGTAGSGGITVAGSGYTQISGSFAGSGSSVISGLTKNDAGQLDLDPSASSNLGSLAVNAGSVTVGGGSLTLTGSSIPLYVGSGSAATLTVSGGALLTASTTASGSYSQIDGPANTGALVTGTGSRLNFGAEFDVGVSNSGTLSVQSGGTVTARTAYIGYFFGSTGAVTVSGAGSQLNATSVLFVGDSGGGSLTIQAGGAVTTPYVEIAANPGSNGAVTVTGAGSALTATNLDIGYTNAPGQLMVMAGGGVGVPGVINFYSSASTITVNGGTLTTGSLGTMLGAVPSIYLSDPAGGAALTIGTGNATSTYGGPIADSTGGPGTVNKVGTGTLTLTGHLTNTGGFTASAGTIDFSGALVQPGTGSLTAAAGATIQYDSGTRVFGGFLYGPGTHKVAGATFSGTTAFNSAVINVTGAGSFVSFTNGGTLTVSAGASSPTSFSGFTNQASGAITIGAGSAINAADFETYGTLSLTPNTAAAPTILTNTGTSALDFGGGSRTFIGTPATADPTGANILDYVDLHGNNAIVAGGLLVNNGGVFDTVSPGTGTIIADFGSLVKGAGFYQNTVKTQNGGKFQTGNSPGSASFGNFVFGPGGVSNYIFAIDDATGTAGPSPNASGLVSGWGLIKAVQVALGSGSTGGNFTWTATPSNPLTVAIDTLVNPTTVGTDVAGPMADFDPNQSYSWTAAHWTGIYSGPTDAATLDADTSFDTSGIVNPIAGAFGWSLDPADQTLSLVYTPSAVPEPGTMALLAAAAAGGIRLWRRRRAGPAAAV